ncbi:hypothetical protein KSP39_PZI021812 [Platanthera zijinensis]|uniref:Uncharacterized protein n=1 Tax=Platanthera zijinensis TaxID=2320716 RepID=A0AAP0AYB2_9ASPA
MRRENERKIKRENRDREEYKSIGPSLKPQGNNHVYNKEKTVNQVLNQIVYELPAEHPLAETRPLHELLGHTPTQVVAGAILGFTTASIAYALNKSRTKTNKKTRNARLLINRHGRFADL